MNYKLLFFLIEGDDDERFFLKIIKTKFEEKYDSVQLWKHAKKKNTKIDDFLGSIKAMGADYIYVEDINRSSSVRDKKREIQHKFNNIDEDRIILVIMEIESWYLAGIDAATLRLLSISPYNTTDSITKERFNSLIPKNFDSRIDFMLEILKCFSIETAMQKNKSFRYFLEEHNCEFKGY